MTTQLGYQITETLVAELCEIVWGEDPQSDPSPIGPTGLVGCGACIIADHGSAHRLEPGELLLYWEDAGSCSRTYVPARELPPLAGERIFLARYAVDATAKIRFRPYDKATVAARQARTHEVRDLEPDEVDGRAWWWITAGRNELRTAI